MGDLFENAVKAVGILTGLAFLGGVYVGGILSNYQPQTTPVRQECLVFNGKVYRPIGYTNAILQEKNSITNRTKPSKLELN